MRPLGGLLMPKMFQAVTCLRAVLAALLAALVLVLGSPMGREAEAGGPVPAWQPAACPLPTRWFKEVAPDKVLPEYPRPQRVRPDWRSLNGLWQFAVTSADAAAPVGRNLPGRILVPFAVESALSGVRKEVRPGDRIWYRRFVEIPKDWSGRRVLLHFGAVDWEATVHVNGRRLGAHRGGYDAFSFDITDALDKRGGPQEILVGVMDPTDQGDQPRGKQVLRREGIWFSAASGIWQTVWLEPVPERRIEGLSMTPDLAGRCLRLKVNASAGAAGLDVTAVVREGDAEISRTLGLLDAELRLPVPTMKLWSPESPFLYGLRVSLGKGEKPADSVESYFGMRKVEVAGDGKVQRILLNGKFLFQVGVLDQGYWPDGLYTAPTDAALRYDLETARRLGFNMVRKHAKVEPDRWYYWADKLGLLVWQDMPSGGNRTPEAKRQFEAELDRLVEGLRHHPSVITWVLFNEGWGQFDTERLAAHLKSIDPSRLVDSASGWRDAGVGDLVDTHHYPEAEALPPEGRRASVVGEFGGIPLPVEGHTWAPAAKPPLGRPGADPVADPYGKLLRTCWRLKGYPGASAVVYTEIADVETEYAGLMTYDREVVKGDAARIAAANRGESNDQGRPDR